MFAMLGRVLHHLAAIAGIVAAVYAALTFHSASGKMDESEANKQEAVEALVSSTAGGSIQHSVEFSGLDMDLKLRLSLDDGDLYGDMIFVYEPGIWRIPEQIAWPMRQVLAGLRSDILAGPETRVEARVIGTADRMGVNPSWFYYGPRVGPYVVRKMDNTEELVAVEHGGRMSNEKLACLRAHEAGAIVVEALGVRPELSAYVSPEDGERYAVVLLHIENALLEDFNNMNRLERDITKFRFALNRLAQRLTGTRDAQFEEFRD